MARTPSGIWVSTIARRNGCGGEPVVGTRGSLARLGPPSIGRPRASRTRPRSCSPIGISRRPGARSTGAPARIPEQLSERQADEAILADPDDLGHAARRPGRGT